MTQAAFDLLLARLDNDRQRAGAKYELLRRKLVKFFAWRGCKFPEDLADDTINRLAKNLEAGEKIDHLEAYCVGIARHVFLESLRARRQEEALNTPPTSSAMPREESDRQWGCLERCVQQLPQESFHLITRYCQEDEDSRIKARRNLAEQLGIPMNALRIRAHRIRTQLEKCVQECMQRSERKETNPRILHSEVQERK